MAPWHDVLLANPFGFGGNGSVFIAKTGAAPNRKFILLGVLQLCFHVPNSLNTFQIVLHEVQIRLRHLLILKILYLE